MKLAIAFDRKGIRTMAWAQKMMQPLRRDGQEAGVERVGSFGLARAATFDCHSNVPMIWRSEGGNVLVVSGVPISRRKGMRVVLQEIVALDPVDAAKRLSELDGAFTAVMMDLAEKQCLVVSDFLGLQPTYYHHDEEGFLLSSELTALCAVRQPEPDATGWGQFVAFGHGVGHDTQCMGVRRLRGGTILRYDGRTGTLDSNQYWRVPPLGTPATEDVDPAFLVKAVEDDVTAYQEYCQGGTVLLSGGFDSRLILAALSRMGISTDIQIVQHEGHFAGAEGRFAFRVADRLSPGTVTYTRPDRRFYSTSKYSEYLWANEVATPSESLFIAQVAGTVRPHMQAVWEGVCPGYAFKASNQTGGGFDVYLAQAGIAYVRNDWRWEAVRRVFHPDFAEAMYSGMVRSVQAEIKRLGDDELGVRKFMVQNRMANRTAPNPTQVYANHVIPFLPGHNRDIWDAVLLLPYDQLRDHRLYRKIYQSEFAELLDIPFCSEKGVFTAKTASVTQALRKARAELGYQYGKVRARIRERRPLQRDVNPEDTSILGKAAKQINLDRHEIDADSVRGILDTGRIGGKANQYALRLVGYWSAWNRVMRGEPLL